MALIAFVVLLAVGVAAGINTDSDSQGEHSLRKISTGARTRNEPVTLEMGQPKKCTPSGFRAQNYKNKVGVKCPQTSKSKISSRLIYRKLKYPAILFLF